MPKSSASSALSNPAALRRIFGQNLRNLCAEFKSVSEVCRTLGINRTQFNRYLSGESFPRPDVLHHICDFFNVDARILLEPLETTEPVGADLINHPYLNGFFGQTTSEVAPEIFPSGFYRFARQSFLDATRFAMGIVLISRQDNYTFLRGFEPRSALRAQGLSTQTYTAEFRGVVMRQEEGVMAVVTHRDSLSCSFNFLAQDTAFQSNIWEGYASRTVREKVSGRRATRMVYEHVGERPRDVLPFARRTGVVGIEEVPAYFLHLLRPDEEFR